MSNLFDSQLSILNSSIYLSSSGHYFIQIRCLEAILGLILLFQIITLILRYKSGSFWLFRFVSSNSSSNFRFICPNSIILYTVFGVIYGICLQAFISTLINYGEVGSNLTNIMLWRSLTWIPLWLAAWSMTWATFLSPILSKQSLNRSNFFTRNPLLVNTFFLLIPLILISALLPSTLRLNSTYIQIFKNYRILSELLIGASKDFNNGLLTDSTELLKMQALGDEMISLSITLLGDWSTVFGVWAAFIGFCGLMFCISAIKHFRSIGNAISQMQLKSKSSNMISTNTSNNNRNSDYSQQMKHLAYSFRSLAFTSIIVACMCIGFTSLDIILASKPEQIATGGILAELVLLVYLYLFAIFGGIASISILIASIFTSTSLTNNQISTGEISIGGIGVGGGGKNSNKQLIFNQTRTVEIELELDQVKRNEIGLESDKETFDIIDLEPSVEGENWTSKDQPFYVR